MLDKTSDIAIAAEGWLAEFESALAALDEGALKKLFHTDRSWRDALALAWTLQTIKGSERLCRARSDRAGDRRRAKRPLDRRAAEAAQRRHADRRPHAAYRRQLAQALSRADAAQPGPGQSPALHAVSPELADLYPQGQ